MSHGTSDGQLDDALRAAQTQPAYAARDPRVAKLDCPRRASTS